MLLILTSLISLSDARNCLVEWEGRIKRMSLYHQRRYAKLGYSAASALDLLHMLLHELRKIIFWSSLANCTWMWIFLYWTASLVLLYLDSDTTFVNMCWDQQPKDLFQILPALYRDLADGNMHTLDKYHVSYKHLPAAESDIELVKEILYLMCVQKQLIQWSYNVVGNIDLQMTAAKSTTAGQTNWR